MIKCYHDKINSAGFFPMLLTLTDKLLYTCKTTSGGLSKAIDRGCLSMKHTEKKRNTNKQKWNQFNWTRRSQHGIFFLLQMWLWNIFMITRYLQLIELRRPRVSHTWVQRRFHASRLIRAWYHFMCVQNNNLSHSSLSTPFLLIVWEPYSTGINLCVFCFVLFLFLPFFVFFFYLVIKQE
jgi:hypothetical protein